MKVKEAAEKYQLPVKKLLDELQRKFPEMNWSQQSELPEGFSEAVESHAQNYAEAETPLPKGEITNTQQAIADNRHHLEAIEYGVLEAIAQLRRDDVIITAHLDAVQDIQLYQSAYGKVWEGFYSKEVSNRSQRSQDIAERLKEMALTLNQDLGKRQGELIQTQVKIQTYQQKAKEGAEDLINTLLQP
jgi:hypothetical protein